MSKRFVGHDGPEVRAADANVDDILNGFAGVTTPLATTHLIGEGRHALEHVVHLRHDVDAVDVERAILGHAQGDVKHGAIFRDVDVLTREHGVTALFNLEIAYQLSEERQRLVGNEVLRKIEVETHSSAVIAKPPSRIFVKEFT